MRRREPLIGIGLAGAIGAIALCVLLFMFTFVASQGVPEDDHVQTLPSVQEGRAALGRATPSQGAATPGESAPLPPGRGAPSPSPAPAHPLGPGRGW
jgi:hypothetical protein